MTPADKTRARRNLFKALASGGAAVVGMKALPEKWVRPVLETVEMPLHAQASCLVYGATGLDDAGFALTERATVCVTVCGNTATATFQTSSDFGSFTIRTGTFTNGSGTMAATSVGTNCGVPPSRAATLTNITGSSLTFTMQRGSDAPGPFIAVLPVLQACPTFPSLTSCVGD